MSLKSLINNHIHEVVQNPILEELEHSLVEHFYVLGLEIYRIDIKEKLIIILNFDSDSQLDYSGYYMIYINFGDSARYTLKITNVPMNEDVFKSNDWFLYDEKNMCYCFTGSLNSCVKLLKEDLISSKC